MLLVRTALSKSSIHGHGLFAAEPIPQGTAVWRFTPGVDAVIAPSALQGLPASARAQIDRYAYRERRTGEVVLCSDDARFMNHDENPAVVTIYAGDNDPHGECIATRDLATGDELTCDYTEFDLGAETHLADGPLYPSADAPVAEAEEEEWGANAPSFTAADRKTSYVDPRLEIRQLPRKGRSGLFTRESIAEGSIVLVWGGEVVDRAQWHRLTAREKCHSVQIEEDLYFAPTRKQEEGDCINHSCEPNCGLRGQIVMVAMRDIQADEEICFDYAMTDGTPYDEFDCGCGATTCRGRVGGDDWRDPALQARYAGYFSPYLQRRIAALAE